ncbi:galaxin [Elysia marginata]|uniref:Galaxin n=1 Tax=Elysia marginata TaxID=1093978 RepID=A0AAV4GW08_9GAST|nr:galaxin [Elysia marginata]
MCRRLVESAFLLSQVLLACALLLHATNAQPEHSLSDSALPAAASSSSDSVSKASQNSEGRSPGYHGDSDNKDVALVKSPFTPPPSGFANPDRSFRPRSPHTLVSTPPRDERPRPSSQGTRQQQEQQRNSDDVTSAPRRKADAAPKPVGSPFRPPVQTEWREGQRVNAPTQPMQEPAIPERIIPSVPPRTLGSPRSQGKVTNQGSPKESVSNQEKDMHDPAPGVTQWTRYTPRPKVRGQEEPSDAPTGRCGSSRYSPRSQICCQGRVQRRQGMKPSCCGRQSFDSAFSKCCDGIVSLRTSQQPECS